MASLLAKVEMSVSALICGTHLKIICFLDWAQQRFVRLLWAQDKSETHKREHTSFQTMIR